MSVIPVGYVQAWLQYDLNGTTRDAFTQLGYAVATPPFGQLNADALILAMATSGKQCLASDSRIIGGFVLVGSDGGNIRYDVLLGTAQDGSRAGSQSPPQVSLLLKKVTASAGRRNRGRMYLPGPSESDTTQGGDVASSCVSAMGNFSGDLLTMDNEAGTNVGSPVLFHDTAPTTPTVITNIVAQTKVATQRRRLVR